MKDTIEMYAEAIARSVFKDRTLTEQPLNEGISDQQLVGYLVSEFAAQLDMGRSASDAAFAALEVGVQNGFRSQIKSIRSKSSNMKLFKDAAKDVDYKISAKDLKVLFDQK